jgi:3-hydroxyisobutyrate dehydrogenase-like beta-hydroxyacid dehydrogenase
MESERESVGVVGVGAMGAPLAGHLVRAGWPVVVVDRTAEHARQVADEVGAGVAASAGELGSRCAHVLVVVDDDIAVQAVVEELVTDPGRLRTIVVCSTVRPATVQAMAEHAATAGVALLDAAMIGGIRGITAGTMTVLVGGEPDVLDAARDVLAPWSERVHHLGGVGAGQVAKSANNLIHWAQVCAYEEAFRLVAAAGVSVTEVRRALMNGPADSRALRELEQMKLTWWKKDLAGSADLARNVGTAHRVGDLCAELMPGITVASLAELLGR